MNIVDKKADKMWDDPQLPHANLELAGEMTVSGLFSGQGGAHAEYDVKGSLAMGWRSGMCLRKQVADV